MNATDTSMTEIDFARALIEVVARHRVFTSASGAVDCDMLAESLRQMHQYGEPSPRDLPRARRIFGTDAGARSLSYIYRQPKGWPLENDVARLLDIGAEMSA